MRFSYLVMLAAGVAVVFILIPCRYTKVAIPTRIVSTEESTENLRFVLAHKRHYNVRRDGMPDFIANMSTAEFVELTPATPLIIPPPNKANGVVVCLIIVPRSQAEAFGSAVDLAHAIDLHQINDAVDYRFESLEELCSCDGDAPTVSYRVRVKTGFLGASGEIPDLVRVSSRSSESSHSVLIIITAAALLTLIPGIIRSARARFGQPAIH